MALMWARGRLRWNWIGRAFERSRVRPRCQSVARNPSMDDVGLRFDPALSESVDGSCCEDLARRGEAGQGPFLREDMAGRHE